MISTLLCVATCRVQRLCCPPSSWTCTTYLPSGEMATYVALPVVVSRVIFADANEIAFLGWLRLKNLYKPKPAIATASAIKIMAIVVAGLLRFGLANAPVAAVEGTGSTVVGAVARFMAASVVCGRMLVSDSVAVDPSFAVPASLPSDDESLTRRVPSARQKTSASSLSKRLHCGQRFMFHCLEFNL